MVDYKDTSDAVNWPMVSFINNGSEITLEMGIASKPKAQNLEQHF